MTPSTFTFDGSDVNDSFDIANRVDFVWRSEEQETKRGRIARVRYRRSAVPDLAVQRRRVTMMMNLADILPVDAQVDAMIRGQSGSV